MLGDLSWDLLLFIAAEVSWETFQQLSGVNQRLNVLRKDKRLWTLRLAYDFPNQVVPHEERYYRFLYELAEHSTRSSFYLDCLLREMIEEERLCTRKVGLFPCPIVSDDGAVPMLKPLSFPLPIKLVTLKHEYTAHSYTLINFRGYRYNGSEFFWATPPLLGFHAARTGQCSRILAFIRQSIGLGNAVLPYSFLITYADLFVYTS